MKYLREIAQIVTRYREKNPDLIGNDTSRDDTDYVSKLYLGLKEGKISSDLDAAQFVYGSARIDTRYTTLKNRLRRKMMNLLFFLDIREKDFSEQLVARYHNAKAIFWMNTLTTFGARSSAIKLAESALKQALKYNFTLNAIQCSLVLRNYSRFSGSFNQYEKYNQLLNTQLRTFQSEIFAQELYERLTIRFTRSVAEQPDLKDTFLDYLQQLDATAPETHSFTFMMYYYRLKNSALQVGQQYQEAVIICDEAIEYLNKNAHIAYKLLYGEFLNQKLTCYLYLRQYDEGRQTADAALKLIPEGGANWFVIMEYWFLLEIHTLHFAEAEKVLSQTMSHTRFQFLSDETREKWQLFELYLDFALRQSGIQSSRPDRKRMDPERFLRTVPTFKRDKRGYNIAILILHVMLLLEQNDFGSIIGRIDALRTYRNRYLQVSTNRRSALFFKMLQIMESNSFDPKMTEQKAMPYFDRMRQRTSDVVEAQDSVQILPFEWLWENIVLMLAQKRKEGKL